MNSGNSKDISDLRDPLLCFELMSESLLLMTVISSVFWLELSVSVFFSIKRQFC